MADSRDISWHMPLGQQHPLLGRQHLLLGPTWPPSLPLAGRDGVLGDLKVEEVVISDQQFAAYCDNLYIVSGHMGRVQCFWVFEF